MLLVLAKDVFYIKKIMLRHRNVFIRHWQETNLLILERVNRPSQRRRDPPQIMEEKAPSKIGGEVLPKQEEKSFKKGEWIWTL